MKKLFFLSCVLLFLIVTPVFLIAFGIGVKAVYTGVARYVRGGEEVIFLNPGEKSEIRSIETDAVRMQVTLGNDDITKGDGEMYMLVNLEGISDPIADIRPHMNVAFVIDKSGSMCGQKLEDVKQAVRDASSLLDARDRVSIVAYDTEVTTIMNNEEFSTNRVLEAVNTIQCGTNTNLEGGVRKGISLIREYYELGSSNDSGVDKVILLSDGLANVGVSDARELADITKRLAGDNIRVSTIGVGADYDEKIMTSIAQAGNGNYYFLAESTSANEIFREEISLSMDTVANQLDVEFDLRENFSVQQGIGYDYDGGKQFQPNDISLGRSYSYLFRIIYDDVESNGEVFVGKVKLSHGSLPKAITYEVDIPIYVDVVESRVTPLANNGVYREYLEAYTADELWEVYELLDRNENDKAVKVVEELIIELEASEPRLGTYFEDDINELEYKRSFILSQSGEYINQDEKGLEFQKSNQYDSYEKKYNK